MYLDGLWCNKTIEYILYSIPLYGTIAGLYSLRGCAGWVVGSGVTSIAIAVNLRIGTCHYPQWIGHFLTLSPLMPHLLELGMYYAETGPR